MRVRITLLISIVLNVALVAAFLGWYGPSRRPGARVIRPLAVSAAAGSNAVRIVKTNILVRPRVFNWQEVESADYPTYIDNLRGIGIPENTVRDIIIADVDQLFARKRRQAAAEQDMEWWRSQPSESAQTNALAHALDLEQERTALLSRLLGANWKADRLDQQPDPVPLTGPMLGALPDDVKQSVQDIVSKSGERMRAFVLQAQVAGQQPNELDLARMREQTREQLAQVLNPQQLEEFLLRNSYNATSLRRELNGVDVSPEEFRRLFRAVDAIDRDVQLHYSGDDPESRSRRAALEEQKRAALRETLGTERFDTFTMLHDPAYQEAVNEAQRVGVSTEAGESLYEIRRATNEEISRIRNDPTLTEGEKQQQIREAEAEQQRARALVLGEPPPAPPEPAAPPMRPYTMLPGDTMGKLSLRYGVGISALRAANPGIDINRLPPGATINVPTGPEAAPLPPLPYPPGTGTRVR